MLVPAVSGEHSARALLFAHLNDASALCTTLCVTMSPARCMLCCSRQRWRRRLIWLRAGARLAFPQRCRTMPSHAWVRRPSTSQASSLSCVTTRQAPAPACAFQRQRKTFKPSSALRSRMITPAWPPSNGAGRGMTESRSGQQRWPFSRHRSRWLQASAAAAKLTRRRRRTQVVARVERGTWRGQRMVTTLPL